MLKTLNAYLFIFFYYFKASSPACTELEILIMNWLGKMVGLTDDFLHTSSDSKGGGVIQVRYLYIPHTRTANKSKTLWLY